MPASVLGSVISRLTNQDSFVAQPYIKLFESISPQLFCDVGQLLYTASTLWRKEQGGIKEASIGDVLTVLPE